MFLFVKMALVTCAFYLLLALIMEGGLFLLLWKTGGGPVGYRLSWSFLGTVFGVMWLISFALTWLALIRPMIASLPRPPFR